MHMWSHAKAHLRSPKPFRLGSMREVVHGWLAHQQAPLARRIGYYVLRLSTRYFDLVPEKKCSATLALCSYGSAGPRE